MKSRRRTTIIRAWRAALALCAAAVLALVSVWNPAPVRASGTGTLTVTEAKVGSTYTAYRLFDATVDASDADDIKVAYQASGAQKAFYESQEGNVFLFTKTTVDDVYIVSVREDVELSESDVTDFLEGLYASGALDELVEEGLAENTASAVAEDTELTITGLPYGYYYVTSLMGSVISVTNVAPDATIEEKNEAPTVDKGVSDEVDGDYSDCYDTEEEDQKVYFLITIHAHKGAEGYILHDRLDEGLTLYPDTIAVSVGDTVLTEGTDYTLLLENGSGGHGKTTDGCTFEIIFSEDFLDGIDRDTDISVIYRAQLNKDAVMGRSVNWNTTWLSYGADSEWDTEEAAAGVRYWHRYRPGESSGDDSSEGTGTSAGTDTDTAETAAEGSVAEITALDLPVAESAEGTLPQTGQLNWPVPVLAGLGMVLFLLGFALSRSGKESYRA